jgi:hypothetical protein
LLDGLAIRPEDLHPALLKQDLQAVGQTDGPILPSKLAPLAEGVGAAVGAQGEDDPSGSNRDELHADLRMRLVSSPVALADERNARVSIRRHSDHDPLPAGRSV